MATLYMDPEGGNDANDGTSFANRFKTFSSGATAARTAPGDTIRIMASRKSTLADAGWTKSSNTVTLAAGVTQTITNCDSNWTAASNVTASTVTSPRREGTNAVQLAIAGAFTTGKVAHFAISSLDLSGYQQISFWIHVSAAIAANVLQLKLCSDSSGDTPVDTIDIPAIGTAGRWFPITVDKAAALGSSVQSVALYATSDPGIVTVVLDHIIACKDKASSDCLTLSHLVRKSGTKALFGIRSIDGSTLTLETGTPTGTSVSNGSGFTGASGTADLVAYMPQHMDAATNTVNESGATNSPITYEGGYNRTDMSSIDDSDALSVFDGLSVSNFGLTATAKDWLCLKNIVCVRYNIGTNASASGGQNLSFQNCYFVSCSSGWLSISLPQTYVNCKVYVTAPGTQTVAGTHIDTALEVHASATTAVAIVVAQMVRGQIGLYASPMAVTGQVELTSLTGDNSLVTLGSTSTPSGTALIVHGGSLANASTGIQVNQGYAKLRNVVNDCSTEVSVSTGAAIGYVSAKDHDDTADNHKGWTAYGTWASQTAVRHTASGLAWEVKPTSSFATADTPVIMPIEGGILCVAGEQVQASVWLRRTNTALTGKLVCRGGQIAGVANDVSAEITAAADTWQQVTIQFTPTETGVVNLELHAYGGTTHTLYVDDLSLSSAP